MKRRVSVIIHGRVQGVAFRHHTFRQALGLGVKGWVRNLPDGSVAGVFEGDASAVAALIDWCRQGPPAAQVDRVDLIEATATGEFDDFIIKY